MTDASELAAWRRFVTHCTERMARGGLLRPGEVRAAFELEPISALYLDAYKNSMSASEYLFWNKFLRGQKAVTKAGAADSAPAWGTGTSLGHGVHDLHAKADAERRRLDRRLRRAEQRALELQPLLADLTLGPDEGQRNQFAQVLIGAVELEATRMELEKVDFVDRLYHAA